MRSISILLLCLMSSSTVGSNSISSTVLSIEDAIVSLGKRVAEMEAILIKYQKEMNQLTEKLEDVETKSRTNENELFMKFQEFEETGLKEKVSEIITNMEKTPPKTFEELSAKLQKVENQLTAKIEEVEKISRDQEKELFMKLQVLKNDTLDEKEGISKRLSEMETASAKSFEELSDKLQKDKNSFVMTDTYILMELQQVQKKAFEATEKINNVTYVLETEHSKIEILQVKLNETREVVNSCCFSQCSAQDAISQNISLSAENLRLYVNESLKLGFESMQSNLSLKMKSFENSLLKCEKHCADDSYISQLNESLQNLDKTVKDELQPIQAELNERVKQLEDNNKREINSTNISANLHEDNCCPPCQNGGTCVAGNVCSCGTLFSGERCQDDNCIPPCQNGGTCVAGNICSCDPLFSGERCQDDHSLCGYKPSVHINGTFVSIWPWMAALYNKQGNQNPKFLCGGSIIDRHFILTTAYCLPRTGNYLIEVHLDSRITSNHEFITKKIHIHPLFNTATWDYDIALLELEKPIDYNFFLRPVCKPQEETFASNIEVVAVDRYQASFLQLKENVMSISDREVCKQTIWNYYGDNYFSDRGFCAGINEKPLICNDGIGGPAMQSHVNKDGRRIWTQVGILSWGDKCGTSSNYLYFTDLKKLMSWVNSVIKDGTKK